MSSQAGPSVESAVTRAQREARMESAGGGTADWTNASASIALERNIPMLLGRIASPLGVERRQRFDQSRPGIARIDDVVQIPAGRRLVGVRELVAVLRGALFARLSFIEDLDGAFGSHHRDFRGGPGDVVVAANVLGAHDVVRA